MKTETYHQGCPEPIVIRVAIERLRQEMVHGIMLQNRDLQDCVEKAVNDALKDFRFDGLFYEAVNKQIDREVQAIASHALHTAFTDPALRETVEKSTLDALKKKFPSKKR